MLAGRRIAIDVGTKRIGLAITDSENILCSPLATVSDLTEVLNHLDDNVGLIYVGLPLNLKREFTPSTKMAIKFAEDLGNETAIPIRLIDERLTTNLAHGNLRQAGRNTKSSKEIIDQVSAVVILEEALRIEKITGSPAGKSLEEVQDES